MVVVNLKFARIDIRPRELVQARVFHIHDAPTIQADEVVMLAELGVEARRRTRMTGSGHQAEGNEGAQNAMDRHAGDLGQWAADLAVELLSRRVVAAVQDRFKDGAPLGRDRQAAFAMGGEEAVHSLLFIGGAHGLGMSICTKR